MDAIRKQATKLREQVARQQQVFLTLRLPIPLPLHRFLVLVNRRMSRSFCSLTSRRLISRPVVLFLAVLKQFGGGGYGISDNVITDEAELQQYRRIEQLYISTRSSKHFQRDIVRGVEGFIVTGSKQVEIGTKLSDDSRKYGVENSCTSDHTLSKAALIFSQARSHMEKERENLLKSLSTLVVEPLRAMVVGAQLEDARHLAQRYEKMRQEAEVQTIEVSKCQIKLREAPDMVTIV
ncbi:unnamed protein product [Musa textilis]